jgi:hypothetical protein
MKKKILIRTPITYAPFVVPAKYAAAGPSHARKAGALAIAAPPKAKVEKIAIVVFPYFALYRILVLHQCVSTYLISMPTTLLNRSRLTNVAIELYLHKEFFTPFRKEFPPFHIFFQHLLQFPLFS